MNTTTNKHRYLCANFGKTYELKHYLNISNAIAIEIGTNNWVHFTTLKNKEKADGGIIYQVLHILSFRAGVHATDKNEIEAKKTIRTLVSKKKRGGSRSSMLSPKHVFFGGGHHNGPGIKQSGGEKVLGNHHLR